MRVLGLNGVFHDPAAAVVVDGEVVAAAEEERFTRRKHGKAPVAFSTWELPEHAIHWCLKRAGIVASQLDAVAYSYDPALAPDVDGDVTSDNWEGLRTLYVERLPLFLRTLLPDVPAGRVRFVAHHLAHAASAYLAAPCDSCAVLVLDGRGERSSHLAGHARGRELEVLASQPLPHSLGLLYEELTAHLGFRRSSDEYKVMALAAYGRPAWLEEFRRLVRCEGEGTICVEPIDWGRYAPSGRSEAHLSRRHANLAATVQRRLEEVLLELAGWLHQRTGERWLTMAGGVALNCVANSRIWRDSPFEQVWVQPAAGDAGTALGAALYVSGLLGDEPRPMRSAALGRGWEESELAAWLERAGVLYERADDLAEVVADALAANQIVAWFQGCSEFGPRALGHRSLLADPRDPGNAERLNEIKGRERFRPVAPMVLAERATEVFRGPLPSPYMLFTHEVAPEWAPRIPGAVHVDGTARVQTVARSEEPLLARVLECFERRTGVPVVINTSLNTAGRPMVDDPRDALECFGSAPIDMLAIGPFVVRRIGSAPSARSTLRRRAFTAGTEVAA